MKDFTLCMEIPDFDVDENTNVWKVPEEDAWMYVGCGNTRIRVGVDSIEEGVEKFFKPIKEYQWGGSQMYYFESGIIYRDDEPVAMIAYNGKVLDVTGKDLRDWKSHEEIKPEDFGDFLTRVKS